MEPIVLPVRVLDMFDFARRTFDRRGRSRRLVATALILAFALLSSACAAAAADGRSDETTRSGPEPSIETTEAADLDRASGETVEDSSDGEDRRGWRRGHRAHLRRLFLRWLWRLLDDWVKRPPRPDTVPTITTTTSTKPTVIDGTTTTSRPAPTTGRPPVTDGRPQPPNTEPPAERTTTTKSPTTERTTTTKPPTTATTERVTTTEPTPITTKRAATTESTTTTTTSAKRTTTTERTTSTRRATTTAATPRPPTTEKRTTADVINPADPSVLFFSDNDDCTGIQNGQRHPDWVEGQSNSSTNEGGVPTYGYAYNTGDETKGEIAWGFAKTSIALSGDCVLSMTINDAHANRRAIRIFRRYDRNGNDLPTQAYYSTWFYFPIELEFDNKSTSTGSTRYGYWNVFQLKNRVGGNSLANLSVNAGKVVGADFMNFSIWRKSECGATEECSRANTLNPHTRIPIPVGRWVHLEMYTKASTGSDGRIIVWQDGREIINFTGQTERDGTERRQWSVNNYGQLHRPASHTLYADDVLISTRPVHPDLFE